MRAFTSRLAFLAAAVVATSSLAACGDDSETSGSGGAGSSSSSSTSSSSPTSSSSSSGSPTSSGEGGGSGGQGTGGDGTGGDGTGGTGTGGDGTGGSGTGGDGTGGAGSGGGQPAECTVGDLVDDDFEVDIQSPADDGIYDCSVEGVDESSPTIETTLFCVRGDIAFDVTLSYTPVPALVGSFPVTVGQEVTLEDLSGDDADPPVSYGYVLRSTLSGKLLFSWVWGSEAQPPLAEDDWAAPLELTEVEDLCAPDDDNYEHRALDVVLGGDAPVRVFSDHIANLGQAPETFEIRVSNDTYNPDIDGGFNSLFRYAILAPETLIPDN